MPTVFDLVKSAGSIPLDELTVLSPQSAETVKESVMELEREGLVEYDDRDSSDTAVVKLTERGYRRAMK